ncbi:MAG: hypothetical protein CVV27_04515, partial [Candidatus Melainabacteria bacterium HGW-Melainabacteria-1]
MEARIAKLAPGLAALHASPWCGSIEEVGTGSWVQALLQSVAGASASLAIGRSSYGRDVQAHLYGAFERSIARATVESWARQNLASGPHRFALAISGAVASPLQRGDQHAWLALACSDGRGRTLHLRCREPLRLQQ